MNRSKKWLIAGAAAAVLLAAAGIIIWQRAGGSQETAHGENKNLVMYVPFGETSYIMVDQDTGSVFSVTMPDEIYDTDGSKITQDDFKKGDLLTIYGDGIMLESYPGQYPGVTRIEVAKRGDPADADQYESITDQLYQKPDPSERPHLGAEYLTDDANVYVYITEGGYTWSYTDESGQDQSVTTDSAFILTWKDIADMTLDPEQGTDLTLRFSEPPERITAERWPSKLMETYQDGDKVPDSEKVTPAEDSEGFLLKDVKAGYVYRITGTWENGTVEYGFLTREVTR